MLVFIVREENQLNTGHLTDLKIMESTSGANKDEPQMIIASVHSSYQEFYSQLNQSHGEYYSGHGTANIRQSFGNPPIGNAAKSICDEHQSIVDNGTIGNVQLHEVIKMESEFKIDNIDAKR